MFDRPTGASVAINYFVLFCIVVIAASTGMIGKTYLGQSWTSALIIAIVAFAALYALRQQALLKRRVQHLARQATEVGEFESDIERRFILLKRQISAEANSSGLSRDERKKINQNMKLVESLIRGLQERLARVESGVDTLGARQSLQGEVPLNQPAKPVTPAVPHASTEANAAEAIRETEPLQLDEEPASAEDQAVEAIETVASNVSQLFPTDKARRDSLAPVQTEESEENRKIALNSTGLSDTVDPVGEEPAAVIAVNAAPQADRSQQPVRYALDNDALELHLQPIVELVSRQPEFYETQMRLKQEDGTYFQQSQLVALAERENLSAELDLNVIFTSVKMQRSLARMQRQMKLFCNVSAACISDPASFREAIEFLEANSAFADLFVLELPQSRFKRLKPEDRARLQQLADLGFCLSLDQVFDLKLNGPELREVGFRYLKVPTSTLLNPHLVDTLDLTPGDLTQTLAQSDIRLIGSEIERETQIMHLIDFDIPLGQGDFFAPPRPVKPELLNPAQSSETVPASAASSA
ncbi:MAG: EAL domain-containing protein [Pseudomonadota bacterium]